MSRLLSRPAVVLLVVVLAAIAPARAQWGFVNLHPPGASESRATGVCGGQQVGYAKFDSSPESYPHAGRWSGLASNWVDLNPAGSIGSYAQAISGSAQVGYALVPDDIYEPNHASLWNGTAGSWVDLNPSDFTESYLYGVWGNQQVGCVYPDYHFFSTGRASLWSGTADSWVNLDPPGSTHSVAYGTSGGQQVGCAVFGAVHPGSLHAGLWSGSSDTWVDLHMFGESTRSVAYGTCGDQQVGWIISGYSQSASLWSGSAASWKSLHPTEAGNSQAFGVADGCQVGIVDEHASLWHGTLESWIDLHDLLPAEYSNSSAQAVDVADNAIWVVGHAFNSTTQRDEAMLWQFTAFAGDTNRDGQVDIDDLLNLARNWQKAGDWSQGDFDQSEFVDVTDLGMLATNWQRGVGDPSGASFAEAAAALGLPSGAVPEPGLIGLLCLVLLRLEARRGPKTEQL